MIACLKANSDELDKRGLNAEFVTEMESNYSNAQRVGNEKESLKTKLKTKTVELNSIKK